MTGAARLTSRPALAVALTIAFLVAQLPAPAAASSDGPCPTSRGVTVVVDYQSLGGGVVTRCTDRAVSSGWDALVATGFNPQGTARFAGFVCRLTNLPAPSEENCQNTPPADAYWGYWYSNPRGSGWTYSNRGAANRVPPEGSVEGWSFSNGSNPKPRASIAALASASPAPSKPAAKPGKPAKPSAPASAKPTTAKPSRKPGQGTPTAGPEANQPTASPDDPTQSASPSEAAVPARPPSPSALGSADPVAVLTTAVDDTGTPSWLTVLWLLPIAAILAAAVILSRRRTHE